MATTRIGITGVGQIAIPVGDVARAASFSDGEGNVHALMQERPKAEG